MGSQLEGTGETPGGRMLPEVSQQSLAVSLVTVLPCVSATGTMTEPSGDARPIPRGSKACRRLFGPVDSEQLRRDCDALMAGCLQEARERWNFDFVTETPLEGDFAWEPVRGLGLPKLYLTPGSRGGLDDLGGGKRPSPSTALLPGTSQEDLVNLSLSCTLVPHSPEQLEGSPAGPGTSGGRKRRQTSMTGEDRCRGRFPDS